MSLFQIDSLQNNWLILLKNIQALKHKERLKNYSTVRETREMTARCTARVLGRILSPLNNSPPFIKKDISGTVDNVNKVVAQIDSLG